MQTETYVILNTSYKQMSDREEKEKKHKKLARHVLKPKDKILVQYRGK